MMSSLLTKTTNMTENRELLDSALKTRMKGKSRMLLISTLGGLLMGLTAVCINNVGKEFHLEMFLSNQSILTIGSNLLLFLLMGLFMWRSNEKTIARLNKIEA